jgi:hypothetical protein
MKTVTRQTSAAIVLMAVLVSVLMSAGCATKRDVADIKEQLIRVEQQSRESSRLVGKIDSLIESSAQSNDALRTEMRATVGDLQQQMAAMLENYQELVRVINEMQNELHSRGILRGSVGDATHTPGGTTTPSTFDL